MRTLRQLHAIARKRLAYCTLQNQQQLGREEEEEEAKKEEGNLGAAIKAILAQKEEQSVRQSVHKKQHSQLAPKDAAIAS